MAYIRKKPSGMWEAQVETLGVRVSESFGTKAEATQWAAARETEIRNTRAGKLPDKTVLEACKKYREDVTPGKKGARWEEIRLKKFEAELPFRNKLLSEVSETDIAAWRDKRLKEVQGVTFNRECNVLRAVFSIARKEWKWMRHDPIKDVSRARGNPHRYRRVLAVEQKAILDALGYSEDRPVVTTPQRVGLAFLFAIETGMRSGEICGLRRENIIGRGARLPETKNGDARVVPLSAEAMRLLGRLPDKNKLFDVTDGNRDKTYREHRAIAAKTVPSVTTLTFHDTRHEACTRLAKKLTVLDLAKMIGHRDLKTLNIYYNPTVDELADRLDAV